jgi:hypothetical protein
VPATPSMEDEITLDVLNVPSGEALT